MIRYLHGLLAALAVGVAHFGLTLFLGPGIHCAEARGCAETDWIQPPAGDVFALPLSLAREPLAAFFEGRSFAYYSVMNSLSLVLLAWAAFAAFAWFRGRS